ncbi:cytochrome P450 [Streptomyces sp. NPDC001678]|uniref:cytochrome P450 n=1 Tax=Streptomyces sp. NPDC001678 TaxID=3364599 RepID=UPI0036D007CD
MTRATASDQAREYPAFPMPPACSFAPPPDYAELHSRAPVTRVAFRDGRRAWLVTSYAYVRRVLADPRSGSNRGDVGFPTIVPLAPHRPDKGNLVSLDPPEHTVLRRLLSGEFTLRRMNALRPRIRRLVDGQVVRLMRQARPVDLVDSFARPVPLLVLCDLLGIPYADHHLILRLIGAQVRTTVTAGQREAARRALDDYLRDHVTAKEQAPADDLLSRIAEKLRQAGTYDREVLTRIAAMLLVAGHGTTMNTIGLGTVGLLREPGRIAALARYPAEIPGTVEELLRYYSVADPVSRRVALAGMRLGNVSVRAGDGIIASLLAANHDSSVFPDPSSLRTGHNARHHLAFGYGVHQCLGQNLARVILQCVLASLSAHVPGLRLAVPERDLPLTSDATTYGLREAWVAW